MKTRHFEMLTVLLAAVILMDVFQVKSEILDMADNAFDDEYLKCTKRMEIKYVPQLLKEEIAGSQILETVWEKAKTKWEAQKTQLFLPVNFKDNHGIALIAYIAHAQDQTPFYQMFNEAVQMAGQSREDYIYSFQFKAFHFYLTRALQLLRKPCEDAYKSVVYSTGQGTSFLFGGLNQARFGRFTLAYPAVPQAVTDQHSLLMINTCFGVSVEEFLDKENEGIVVIPLNEVFHVSQEGAGNSLILQSTNKTCSHYECAFLGGLKTENCIENIVSFQSGYVDSPDEKNQKLEDPGMESQEPTLLYELKNYEPTEIPGMKIPEPFSLPGIKVIQMDEKPEEKHHGNSDNSTPGPLPFPGPKSHPSASSGEMLLPPFGMVIIVTCAFARNLFVAL